MARGVQPWAPQGHASTELLHRTLAFTGYLLFDKKKDFPELIPFIRSEPWVCCLTLKANSS